MFENFDVFIQLDRTFRDLSGNKEESDSADLLRLWRNDKPTQWSDLLEEPRVIILSEAGSGKTTEIRQACRALRLNGKRAFFLRIEHLVQDFDTSFEEGTPEEFRDWVSSGEKGWLLLDSVDEARLKDPKDFERAIRTLGQRLRGVIQRAHIIISSRGEAWRPKTDLSLCETCLPWPPPATEPEHLSESEEAFLSNNTAASMQRKSFFRIVALNDLAEEQVDRFAMASGVIDLTSFRKALDRAEAWSFTTRPLDLAETIEFWLANGRVGSRLELLRASIDKRLVEGDQDRADANPISKERIRGGARLVAAASTLTKESAIRVPDGLKNGRGLDVKQVLTDWDDADCRALLTRPIFDEGLYGTVRFHHRSVREFLTAEWLHSLLVDEGSRARIEKLFFRTQYGVEVVVPTMRPILPWLAILDQPILDKVMRLAPEILFEGGDPVHLPFETRIQILRDTCEQLSQPAHGRSVTEYSAVQRFSNPDLANVIRELLIVYKDENDVVWFLLRMVHQGGISGLAKEAKHFAITSQEKYTRIAAIRAVIEVGSKDDVAEVRQSFITESPPLKRAWLSELLDGLDYTSADVEWLVRALELTVAPERFGVDTLSKKLSSYVSELPLNLLADLLEGLSTLLNKSPVIERRHCKISKNFSWLAQTAGQILMRTIPQRDPAMLRTSTLAMLRKLPIAENYGEEVFKDIRNELPKLIREWPELNRELFWFSTDEVRSSKKIKNGERLTDCWDVMAFGTYCSFDISDFDWATGQVKERPLLDEKLVALTLAIQIFRQNARPRAWRERLKIVAAISPVVEAELKHLLKRPRAGLAKFKRQEAAWQRRLENRAAKEVEEIERAKSMLASDLASIRSPSKIGEFTNNQYYLLHQMRSSDSQHNSWTDGNWHSLTPSFGEDVARAFRDGAVGYWRHNVPKLRVEGAKANSVPWTTIFGLTGLSIEARETDAWPSLLTIADAKNATRYALQELNGFPSWLPKLHNQFPTEVLEIIVMEILHELFVETSVSESHYVLYDVSWHGEWIWNEIAPALLPTLRAKRVNKSNLGYLLAIVNRSSVEDEVIAAIASRKAKTTRNLSFSPLWFAMWVGVDPDAAIPALAARLASIANPVDQTKLALLFIVSLLGGRSQEGRARQAFRTVEHMKSLYLLMARYIQEKDDIHRAGTGVYSPGLRDDAQDARNALIAFIRETPGKEAFLALLEMARAHPDAESQPWMAFHAKAKATADSDITAWPPAQVREFSTSLVATPSNHRELWYHAVDKLEALKHDLEDGDTSIAGILQSFDKETEFRTYIGGWCRDRSAGRYSISHEDELADAKRPDIRFFGFYFDAPVPVELKLADKWSGPKLFESLEVQLCGDYLRDDRSSRGIFLLVYLGKKLSWDMYDGGRADTFERLVDELQNHWRLISSNYPGVEDIQIIGIDLTRRGTDTKATRNTAGKLNRKS